jgi:Domain found in Dishevelled, Egl-10, and Pleckstrin (DEP)
VKNVLLFSHDQGAHSLLRTVAGVVNSSLTVTTSWTQTLARLTMSANEGCIVLIGLDSLAPSRRSATQAVAQVRDKLPNAIVVLLAERKPLIDDYDRAWSNMCGADAIFGTLTATRWHDAGDALLKFVEPDESLRTRTRQRVAPYIRTALPLETKHEASRRIAACELAGIDLAALARRMGRSGGVDIRDRSYHLRSFPECFVASDAVDWIAKACAVDKNRAVAIGRAMQDAGLIYHVAREQLFDDAYFFFRVARLPESFVIADFVAQVNSSRGFDQRDRTYLGTEYKRCFIGKEAIAWCQAHRMSANEAMSAGQRLIDLSIASHVIDEHPLKDDTLFYRFHGV